MAVDVFDRRQHPYAVVQGRQQGHQGGGRQGNGLVNSE